MLSDVAAHLPSDMKLAVKPHPQSPYRPSYLRKAISKDIFIASHYETRDLLERCEAIITVNSSVGPDGFLFNKPVIALGNAPWVKSCLAFQAKTPADVAKALASPPSFDKILRKRFLAHWYHAYTWSPDDEPKTLRGFVGDKLRALGYCGAFNSSMCSS